MYGNYLPPNPLIEWIGRTALKLMGWRIEGELPRLVARWLPPQREGAEAGANEAIGSRAEQPGESA